MELRQLRYFVTVAEELHFGRAAERLHIGQPAVSQQIRQLERELGVELFDRSPRHVRLTEAGRRFLPEARTVLAAEERARAIITDLLGERGGTLRLGTSDGLGARLEAVLDEFARRAPKVHVELVSATTRTRLDRVRAGQLDATFVRGIDASPQLRLEPVWTDQVLVALPANNALAGNDPIGLAELATVPLRLTERRRNPPLYDLVVNACRAAGFTPVFGPAFTTMQDTIASIGVGAPSWTVLYDSHARVLPAPRVAFRPLAEPLTMPTYLAMSRVTPPPAIAVLRAACAMAARIS
ncbi:MAG TPA: LysR substrate-binding domain-containing protein [Pseudonocardiaceae bacterium]|nr:LysR substrate-binding domain-containing protein [Pseudonocardiaceae bacterium]